MDTNKDVENGASLAKNEYPKVLNKNILLYHLNGIPNRKKL